MIRRNTSRQGKLEIGGELAFTVIMIALFTWYMFNSWIDGQVKIAEAQAGKNNAAVVQRLDALEATNRSLQERVNLLEKGQAERQ